VYGLSSEERARETRKALSSGEKRRLDICGDILHSLNLGGNLAEFYTASVLLHMTWSVNDSVSAQWQRLTWVAELDDEISVAGEHLPLCKAGT